MKWSSVNGLWIATPGLVTAIYVEAGDSVSSSTPILAVDALPVVGWHTPAPFHRSLVEGDRGIDVQMLADILISTGILFSGDKQVTYFDSTLADAVFSFNQRFELSDSSDFDHTKIVWLPSDPVWIASSDVQIGQELFGRTSGFTTRPELLAANLRDFSKQLSSWEQTWIVLPDGTEIALNDEGQVPSTALSALEAVVATGVDALSVRVEQRLGNVSLVPVTAVQRSAAGTACIYTSTQKVQNVDIVGGEAALVYLAPIIEAEVLANPIDLGLTNCGSKVVNE